MYKTIFEDYVEFHIFADSGVRSLGSVAYMRCVSLSGEICTRLIMSKSHVAPVKCKDSIIVLGHIHNETKRFHTFGANRVSYIRENTLPSSWVKVSSSDNPADMLTRPRLFSSEKQLQFWKTGPAWLSKPPAFWHATHQQFTVPNGDPEVKVKDSICLQNTVEFIHPIQKICDHFSDWKKIVKSVA